MNKNQPKVEHGDLFAKGNARLKGSWKSNVDGRNPASPGIYYFDMVYRLAREEKKF